MKLAELGLFYTSLLRCSDNPVHLNVLLKSTALLEAVQTDLAVEVGVLPGPAAIHPSGTGRHLPRQVLLALNSFRQIVQANMMSLCIWLACTFSFILNVFFLQWSQLACTLCGPSETGWSSSICYRFCSDGLGANDLPHLHLLFHLHHPFLHHSVYPPEKVQISVQINN